jgi:hypothetical protein
MAEIKTVSHRQSNAFVRHVEEHLPQGRSVGVEGKIQLDSNQKATETMGDARTDRDCNVHVVWHSGRHGGAQARLVPT